MNRDLLLLRHILESILWIQEFTSGGQETYFADRKTQSATLRELQTLAESAQRLSDETKAKKPEIFWQGISGFRNVLVHNT